MTRSNSTTQRRPEASFAHGDLRLVILHLIAEKPRHGYEIIKAIEEQVGGAYSPSLGVIYPTLTLLEELHARCAEACSRPEPGYPVYRDDRQPKLA